MKENMNNGFKSIIKRQSNIYGPYDTCDPKESHVISSFIKRVVYKQ